MQKIKFNDLVKIFGAAQATTEVQRFVRKEFKELHLEDPISHNAAKRINQLENDPSTFVMAMKLDDSVWNTVPPKEISLDCDDQLTDIGPFQDPDGKYQVVGEHKSFLINKGDFLFLTSDSWDNVENVEVVEQSVFSKFYVQSENTDCWDD